jgi:hypothetical protein
VFSDIVRVVFVVSGKKLKQAVEVKTDLRLMTPNDTISSHKKCNKNKMTRGMKQNERAYSPKDDPKTDS